MPVHLHPLFSEGPSDRLIGVGRDESVVERLRGEYAVVRAEGDRMAEIFYRRLFAEHPDIRPMFRADPHAQHAKLMDSLDAVMGFLECPDQEADYLRQMGARHAAYGAQPAHYTIVSGLLADAVADLLGERGDAETRADWFDAFRLISDQMLRGVGGAG
jgi:methyl-accepting chemotaxis protein